MNNVLKALLVVCACCLAWLCYDSILTPIEFNEQKDIRDKQVVKRLMDIRIAQTEFRNLKGHYTASFDTLIDFINNDKAKIVLKEGELTDKQLEEGLTEAEAVKQGLIKRDTTFVSMSVSLFGEGFNADSLRYIPFSNPIQEYEINTAEIITGSANIQVKVVEVKAPYKVYLQGLDRQEILNLVETTEKLEKFPGLKFGDVQKANNNAGNW